MTAQPTIPASSTVAVRDAYMEFLARKTQFGCKRGFKTRFMPDTLFDFQKYLTDWSVFTGRAALLTGCGTGKSAMGLTWAQNVVEETNRPVLFTTPLSVGPQLVREGAKFGIDAYHSRNGRYPSGARVVVTNDEKLHLFNSHDFAGMVADESARYKDFDAERTSEVIEFMRTLLYRLLCSAVPAPNALTEIGTQSEILGELGYQDMLSMFFTNKMRGVHKGSIWGGGQYRFRGHAERAFYQWIPSWARPMRMPSDLGFSDDGFILPARIENEHVIEARTMCAGRLFDTVALTRAEVLEERRRTIPERCEKAAELICAHDRPAIAWCDLNAEGDLLARLISGSVQVSGADADEEKEEKFDAFVRGEFTRLVTKRTICAWGMNFQHVGHQTHFATESYEQWWQGICRSWRFGRTEPVCIDLVASEGQRGTLGILRRKGGSAEAMLGRLIENVRDEIVIDRREYLPDAKAEVPSWLRQVPQ